MARLDLVAETIAPICVALIVGYASKSEYTANLIAFILVAAWNWLTAPVEYVLLQRLYQSQPGLQASKNLEIDREEQSSVGVLGAVSQSWELFSYVLLLLLLLRNSNIVSCQETIHRLSYSCQRIPLHDCNEST